MDYPSIWEQTRPGEGRNTNGYLNDLIDQIREYAQQLFIRRELSDLDEDVAKGTPTAASASVD